MVIQFTIKTFLEMAIIQSKATIFTAHILTLWRRVTHTIVWLMIWKWHIHHYHYLIRLSSNTEANVTGTVMPSAWSWGHVSTVLHKYWCYQQALIFKHPMVCYPSWRVKTYMYNRRITTLHYYNSLRYILILRNILFLYHSHLFANVLYNK